jgi:hypothetical protein
MRWNLVQPVDGMFAQGLHGEGRILTELGGTTGRWRGRA